MNKIASAILIVVVAVGVLFQIGTYVKLDNKGVAQPLAGSVGNIPNKATTTDSTWGTVANPSKFRVLKTGPGILSAVVVTDATTGSLTFYDGTTTLSHNIHATTTLGTIAASASETTYTYDAAFNIGLIAVFEGAGAASSTILWQ